MFHGNSFLPVRSFDLQQFFEAGVWAALIELIRFAPKIWSNRQKIRLSMHRYYLWGLSRVSFYLTMQIIKRNINKPEKTMLYLTLLFFLAVCAPTELYKIRK
jgi:hypothetical protein